MLQDFRSVSDHYGRNALKGLKEIKSGFNLFSANPAKWPFDHFVGLALEGLKSFFV